MNDDVKKFKDMLDILARATLYNEVRYSLDFDRHSLMKSVEIFNCMVGGMSAKKMIKDKISIEDGKKKATEMASDLMAFLKKWADFDPHEYMKHEVENDPYVIDRKNNNNLKDNIL